MDGGDEMTTGQLAVEAGKVQSEHDRAMVGHAVQHLNNLMPRFGVTHYVEGYDPKSGEDAMSSVPEQVKAAVARATIAAARYLEEMFDRERLDLLEEDEDEGDGEGVFA